MVEIIAIAVVLAVAVAIVLALAATKPGSFSVRRATTVKAAPEKIFSLINDFHQWGTWSPWENKDPAMKRSFSGAGCSQLFAFRHRYVEAVEGRGHKAVEAHEIDQLIGSVLTERVNR